MAGRESSYVARYAGQAYKLCLLGATLGELADFFGVSEQTIHAWKHEFPEFFDSITRGKSEADANVAERLYQRAMGYKHPAVKIFFPQGASEPVYAEYTEHYPPDTPAASLWLRNRQPDKWRDRHEHTGAGGKDLIPDQPISTDRLAHALLLAFQSMWPPEDEAGSEQSANEQQSTRRLGDGT
jgi:hypothetical protein